MARYISTYARYQLAATAFAVTGGVWCLGALIISSHGMTLLVVGMMNFAASMLALSLRPLKERSPEPVDECERCLRREQTVELSVHRIGIDGPSEEAFEPSPGEFGQEVELDREDGERDEIDKTIELMNEPGVVRPRERKNRTWSI